MKLTLDKPIAYSAIFALCVVMVFPFAWMLSSSLKPFSEIFAGNSFLPEHPTLANYQSLFQQNNAVLKLWNSFYIAAAATAISVFLCALGGYTFAKFRFPGRGLLFSLMLASMALPFAVVMVPLFVMMRNVFHWIDTPWPLIIPGAANAFGIFFMRQYMLSVPHEMLVSIIFFMSSWNNFLWPLAILHSDSMQTVPVMLNSLQGPPGRTAFDVLMAGSVVSVLPMLVIFLILQRRLVAGITSGAIKG